MLYELPTCLIAVGLLGAMTAASELGFRVGGRSRERETEPSRAAATTLKGSVFGLVALLLGFSFSATTARYDLRQRLVLDQANAVGMCHLRAGLLEEASRESIQASFRRCVHAQPEFVEAVGDDNDARSRASKEINRILTDLWVAVEEANRRNPDAVRNSLIVPAANEVIDLSSTRNWAGQNHLPVPVLTLLSASVLVSSLLLGHSSGQAGQRHVGLWLASNLILVLDMYVVLDFDRPRRGLIRVNQTPLIELESAIEERSKSK